MDLGLTGKRALVLAASKGLGRAAAEALSAEGAVVAISSSSEERCAQVARDIAKDSGNRVVGIAADMFSPDAMDVLARQTADAIGDIDILVINHVGPALGLATEVDSAILDSHYRLMVASPLRLVMAVLPGMRKRRWGRILYIAGGSVVHALPNKVMDNVFRPAMVNYTKALANEVAADGVTANVVLPGTFLTDRVHASTASNAALMGISVEDAMSERIRNIPAGRFGRLDEFGAVVAFVSSEAASYVNGSTIRVDGSQTKTIL